ncbi:MAG: hypothetical protein LC104_09990 [Bacteroidales bacterium]|nr:hypothetical protein [Bacteroidales bacterium]
MNTIPEILTPPPAPRKRNAADICEWFPLQPAARLLLEAHLTPRQFWDRLVEAGHLADARRLLAHTLRPESAIWWAMLCLEQSLQCKPLERPEESAAWAAVGHWLMAPSESHRRRAEAMSRGAGITSAAGILASAVFLSGGSISRPGLPGVYPAPYLCGRLCGVVVYLAAVRIDPARYRVRLRQYLQLGLEVAHGWNPPPVYLPEPSLAEPRTPVVPVPLPELPPEVRSLFEAGFMACEGRMDGVWTRQAVETESSAENGS